MVHLTFIYLIHIFKLLLIFLIIIFFYRDNAVSKQNFIQGVHKEFLYALERVKLPMSKKSSALYTCCVNNDLDIQF